jgi:hypothetical protein
MRLFLTLMLVSGVVFGQSPDARKPGDTQASSPPPSEPAPARVSGVITSVAAKDPGSLIIPAGTKIPLALAQAISTKNAREGDAVYASTAFPFVLHDRILVPAGTYIQGRIMRTQKAGSAGKRAEILIHFTSMIYPTGYTVMLPGSIDNTPGADNKGVKDSEGTIQQDKDTGQRVEDAAKDAAVAGTVGTIGGVAAGGLNGARYGGLAGIAGGVAWALLKHGPEVKLDVGTSIEMEIQRDVSIDANRIQVAKAQ